MITAALLCLTLPSPLAQDDALAKELESRCAREVAAESYDGFVAVVDLGGERLATFTSGRLPGGKQASATSVVRAEPLVDLLAAVAALDLVEAGKLGLDKPVSDVLPAFAREGDPVLVAQLMDHSSGLIGWSKGLTGAEETEPDKAALLALVAGLGVQSAPGTCFEHSESNTLVLGALVEAVAEKSFADYVTEALLAPLDLRATGFGVDGAPPSASGSGATREVAGRLVETVEGVHPFGEHELCSTPADLIALARALGAGEIVSARSLALMLEPRRLEDGTMTGVGLGLDLVRVGDLDGFAFGGSAEGTSLHVVRYPGADLTISCVVAHDSAELLPLARDLARLSLGLPLDPLSEGVELPLETAGRLVGTYQVGCTSLVVRVGGSEVLVIEEAGRAPRELVHLGSRVFTDHADRAVKFEFLLRDGEESAHTLVISEHGRRTKAVRL